MKPELTIVTGNELKFQQISHALKDYFLCKQGVFKTYEIQGTPEEIIMHKLKAAYEKFQTKVLVDDTSVHFDALGGFPGPYFKDFHSYLSPYKMGMKFAGTRITIYSRLGYFDGKDPIIAVGKIEGSVVEPEDVDPGNREFELFTQIDGLDKVMYDFDAQEINKYSHRGKALKDLISKLNHDR